VRSVVLVHLAALIFAGLAMTLPTRAYDLVLPGILTRDPHDACDLLFCHFGDTYYMLDNAGTFLPGDTVVVSAADWEYRICDEGARYQYLPDNTIAAWRGYDYGCGILSRDEEYGCGTFHSARFGSFGIGGLSGFAPGDTVRAVGNMDLEACYMIPECGASYCLFDRTLYPCSDLPPAAQSATWSTVKALFRR
jgi:hypothetical protein